MSYKRLTERDEYGNADIIGCESQLLCGELNYEQMNRLTKALNRLAELEDKIESGQVVILPCKVGDEVWYIKDYGFGRKRVEKMYVVGFNFSRGNEEVVVIGGYNEMAREVYATKEAAEAKLKELRGE